MAGIYIHIPYCRQKCIYCNFHFSTVVKTKPEMLAAMLQELDERKDYTGSELIKTIYFGGGTPSVLSIAEIKSLLDKIYSLHLVDAEAEITLEANPDDLTKEKLLAYKAIGINRLSIGIQSFKQEDLELLNRAHNAEQSLKCIELARQTGFKLLTIDLIYGLPHQTEADWKQNLHILASLKIPHFSAYALTVEPKTALHKFVKSGHTLPADDETVEKHFNILLHWAAENGYEHYEISNFCLPGAYAKHNTAYWQGEKYLGIGPSAHSYNGITRRWNISNNALYIKNINEGRPYFEEEILTENDKFNEFLMTGLRTQWGVKLTDIENKFGIKYLQHLTAAAKPFIQNNNLVLKNNTLYLSRQGKLLADGIIAELFHI